MSLILTLNLCNILIAVCGPGWKDDGTVKGYQQLLWQVKLPELLGLLLDYLCGRSTSDPVKMWIPETRRYPQ